MLLGLQVLPCRGGEGTSADHSPPEHRRASGILLPHSLSEVIIPPGAVGTEPGPKGSQRPPPQTRSSSSNEGCMSTWELNIFRQAE